MALQKSCMIEQKNDVLNRITEIEYTLGSSLYHYIAYICISKRINSIIERDLIEFWTACQNANIQMAVQTWCKVFGSKRNNTLHFSSILDKNTEQGFYLRLESEYGINHQCFDEYVTDMKCFRDKYIAHADNYDKPVPYFNRAISAIYVLDSIIRESFDYPGVSWSERYPIIQEDIEASTSILFEKHTIC